MSELLTDEKQIVIMDVACHQIRMAADAIAAEHTSYASTLRPKLFIDGNRWCALYGDSLQDGVTGFGDSPSEALEDFNRAMYAKLDSTEGGSDE